MLELSDGGNNLIFLDNEPEATSLELDMEQLKQVKVSDFEIGDDRLGDEEWNVISEAT